MIIMHSNGSRWLGQPPGDMAELLGVLAEHPLDRSFEDYGNFIDECPESIKGGPLYPPGFVGYFGNFATYSHVFNFATDEPALIGQLNAAIRANQERPDYLDQPTPAERKAAKQAAYEENLRRMRR